MGNIAYIDAQNLHKATTQAPDPWKIDLVRFRKYLKDKYKVDQAFYFMGALKDKHRDLYAQIQSFGYIVMFREHNANLKGEKKGNVDVDIVFQMMRDILENRVNKIVLVSGDGDYKRVVDYLIKIDRFEKILHPCRKFASSLYKELTHEWYAYLDTPDMRKKLEYKNGRGA